MSKEEFLSIAECYYPEFESLKESSNFYDYEKSISEMMQKICCEYMEKQLNEGSVSKDRRKKTLTRYGEISISKSHQYMNDHKDGFGISPYMQELMVYAGHLDSYCRGEEILEKFTSVQVNPAQIYRVTEHVSESLKDEDHKIERTLQPVSNEDILYVQMDGSMIQTRKNEEPWKEVKLGRLFRDADCLNPNTEVSYMLDSQYVGHFGSSADFSQKLGGIIDAYGDLKNRIVFINDGATWIREWIADNYPIAVSVLDFFHASEYLYDFAEKAFSDSSQRKQWCERQKDLLLASQVETVLEHINAIPDKEEAKKKITNYYQNNKERMKYKEYRDIGCGIIGSGAIESAHRTVIQKRMKLAGQRWSTKGAKNMLRLRIISMNKQWAKVIDFLKMPPLDKCA
jgi:hypothetical protein